MAEYRLRTPVTEEQVRKLRVGDVVYLDGIIITGRDQVHRRALELASKGEKDKVPVKLEGMALYHCGPIVGKVDGEWKIYGFGPTTSARMESVEADFIREFGVRLIIGKGGLFERTTQAMKEYGAAYLAYPGGVSVLATNAVKRVVDVHWLDLGVPEAMWVVEVENFGPTMVAIDSHGNNLFLDVLQNVKRKAEEIKAKI
jgi:fumarate hydratase subunit beta